MDGPEKAHSDLDMTFRQVWLRAPASLKQAESKHLAAMFFEIGATTALGLVHGVPAEKAAKFSQSLSDRLVSSEKKGIGEDPLVGIDYSL